ncbi:serpin family protein [Chondromyces crocatus]|nr:serpin family protein [Chondromyces crocatus]
MSIPLVLSLAAAGCTTSSGDGSEPNDPGPACSDPNTAGCVVTSEAARNLNPQVSPADSDLLAKGNTSFALDLYQQLREEPGNLFYSPYSISSALAMTWAGARGQTEQDMAKALRFDLPRARLHPAFNALDLALASRGQGAAGADGQPFRLHVANALWGQTGFSFEQPFLDVLGESYGAGVHVVDFERHTQQALDLINGWVAQKTEDRIKDLLSSPPVTSDTRLVLTNAVYFNAAWQEPFEEERTQPRPFTNQAGDVRDVPTMAGVPYASYGEGAGFKAATLPYDGSELDMVLVLPDDLDAFEQGLDGARFDQVVASMSRRLVDVEMPRFEINAKFSLKSALDKLGMAIAFTPDADLTGISEKTRLMLADVVHQSFVKVNEAGTEAAAATAVVAVPTSAPDPSQIAELHLDRPFLFFIRDIETRAVLFVGRVANP